MTKKRKPMWAHPDFHRELKIESAETGKAMEDITKELADDFKQKRNKRRGGHNGFL